MDDTGYLEEMDHRNNNDDISEINWDVPKNMILHAYYSKDESLMNGIEFECELMDGRKIRATRYHDDDKGPEEIINSVLFRDLCHVGRIRRVNRLFVVNRMIRDLHASNHIKPCSKGPGSPEWDDAMQKIRRVDSINALVFVAHVRPDMAVRMVIGSTTGSN